MRIAVVSAIYCTLCLRAQSVAVLQADTLEISQPLPAHGGSRPVADEDLQRHFKDVSRLYKELYADRFNFSLPETLLPVGRNFTNATNATNATNVTIVKKKEEEEVEKVVKSTAPTPPKQPKCPDIHVDENTVYNFPMKGSKLPRIIYKNPPAVYPDPFPPGMERQRPPTRSPHQMPFYTSAFDPSRIGLAASQQMSEQMNLVATGPSEPEQPQQQGFHSWRQGTYRKPQLEDPSAQVLLQDDAGGLQEPSPLGDAVRVLAATKAVAAGAALERSTLTGRSWRDGAYYHDPAAVATKYLAKSHVSVGDADRPRALGSSWKNGAVYLNPASDVAHYMQPKDTERAPPMEQQEPTPMGHSWKDGAILRKPGSPLKKLPAQTYAIPAIGLTELNQLDADATDSAANETAATADSPAALEPKAHVFASVPAEQEAPASSQIHPNLVHRTGTMSTPNPNYGPVLTRQQGQVKRYGAYKTKDSCKYKGVQQGHACNSFFNYKCAKSYRPVAETHPNFVFRHYYPYDSAAQEFKKQEVQSMTVPNRWAKPTNTGYIGGSGPSEVPATATTPTESMAAEATNETPMQNGADQDVDGDGVQVSLA